MEEIKELDPKNRIDHMTYLPDMEVIDSDIDKKVVKAINDYDYTVFTAADVLEALKKGNTKAFRQLGHDVHAGIYCKLL